MHAVKKLIAHPPASTILALICMILVNAAVGVIMVFLPEFEIDFPLDLIALAKASSWIALIVGALLAPACICFGFIVTRITDTKRRKSPQSTLPVVTSLFTVLMISQIGIIREWTADLSDLLWLLSFQIFLEVFVIVQTKGMRRANYE